MNMVVKRKSFYGCGNVVSIKMQSYKKKKVLMLIGY
jgi:hypothetical protein